MQIRPRRVAALISCGYIGGICTRFQQLTLVLDNTCISPPVILAPMAGITDLPFRRLVARFGAGLVVSEMVGSRELVQARPAARARARARARMDMTDVKDITDLTDIDAHPDARPDTPRPAAQSDAGQGGTPTGTWVPTSVQIAGRDARWMAEAARIAEAGGAPIIDINMGCPAKKVTSGYSGSALMKTPDHALALIEAVTAAVSVPVTLKLRLGWDDDSRNAARIARRAEAAGVRMIAVHGRTRCQFYAGRADWGAIGEVVRAVSVPVIANGDIVDSASARAALAASGAAGVMVGRGARGRPWVLAEIAADLNGAAPPQRPRGADLADMVAGHFDDMLSFYGRALGARSARKHLGWYLDGSGAPAALRRAILTESDPSRVLSLMADALDRPAEVAA